MTSEAIDRLRGLLPPGPHAWQGGLVRLPTWVRDEDGELYRPFAVLWANVETGMVGPRGNSILSNDRDPLAAALDAFVDFAAGPEGGGLPSRVEVRDRDLAAYLTDALASLEIEIAVEPRLPAFDHAASSLCEAIAAEGPQIPGYLEGMGVTVDRVRAFADAAAAFYRAQPWRYLSNEDLLRIESPRPGAPFRYAVVLGAGRQEYGLGFYRSVEAFWESRTDDPDEYIERVAELGVWSLTFNSADEVPIPDADLWEDRRLPLAGDEAYPFAAVFYPNRIRRPRAEALTFMEGLLRALAAATEADLDEGRFTRTVETFDGPADYTIRLPFLLDPPDHQTLFKHGIFDRRALEATSAQVGRFLRQGEFGSLDEMNAAIAAEFHGDPSTRPHRAPESPLERAQELCYEAFDAIGRRRILLARQALAISPDCADAHVLLAEASLTPEEAIVHYRAGVDAGQRALDAARREEEEEVEHLWGRLEARPLLRAMEGLADCQSRLGQIEDAIGTYREILRLNPDDNQGVRYLLLPLLLQADRDAEAVDLLDVYEEDDTAIWLCARALAAFRTQGDSPAARKARSKMTAANSHLKKLLLQDEEPEASPDHFEPGKASEAILCWEYLGPIWRETPGALEWLKKSRST